MKTFLTTAACLLAACLPAGATSLQGICPRDTISFNRDWQFSYASSEGTPDGKWINVNLPHDYQISQPWVEPSPEEKPDDSNPMANIKSRLSARAFKEMGKGYYRKTFTPDSAWQGKRVLLDFEGILLVGDAFLNGKKIGSTDYGYLGFDADISRLLKFGEPNEIVVIADTGEPDNSRWYTGAGLYRDVNVIVTDPDQYFTRNPLQITTPRVSEQESTVVIDAEIATFVAADSISAGVRILDRNGAEVYASKKKIWNNRKQKIREFRIDSLTISSTDLWDIDSPNLYRAEVTLYRPDGSVADRLSERFGFRTIEYSPDFGFKLNGRKVLLKGIANHHTLGALGAAAYPRAIEKRIKLLKDFGFNHIRSSHNPYSKSFLDLCDENGILVVDELYDKWMKQYVGGRTEWSQRWQEDIPEWVRRDRNHPSVIMWSLGNELQLVPDMEFNDWGVTPYRLQRELLRRYDRTRPTTVAMHPRGRNEHTDSLPAPLALETDITAYNYRYMYFPGDSKNFPWMNFYQSEANLSNMGPNYFEMDLDKVIGLAYWGMIDYLGESLGWPAKGWVQGVFDISLQPKPMAYFLRSYFKPEEPIVYIAPFQTTGTEEWNGVTMGGRRFTDSWNFNPGDSINLFTYTNADEVELTLNGKSLGRRRNDLNNPKTRNRILWEGIPYQAGTLTALAYNDGEKTPIARHALQTHGKAVRLTASYDNDSWKADGTDLQHVLIEAVDAKGRCDKSASQQLKFHVDGPAEIVGVINGDNTSPELTVGSSRKLHQGKAVVILRSNCQRGPVTLKITSDSFKSKELEFKTI